MGEEGEGQNLEGSVMETCPTCGQSFNEDKGITVDEETRSVIIDGEVIRLTRKLSLVLGGIVECSPRVASKDYLMDYVYGLETDNEPNTKIIDVYVCKIRGRIKHTRFKIENVWGYGYRLTETPNGSEKQAN